MLVASNDITYKKNAGLYGLIYRRAVKEIHFEVARYFLSLPGMDKASIEEGLLWNLLYQNRQTSQAPIEFLLNPGHSYERISFSASPKLNIIALYRLAMVGQDVRNDGLERTNYPSLSHRLVDYSAFDCPGPEGELGYTHEPRGDSTRDRREKWELVFC